MKINKIYQILNKKFPFSDSMDWDNSGILINHTFNVEKILITLDLNTKILNQALKNNVNLIITHHPFIFNSFKDEMETEWKKNIWKILNTKKIGLIAMHTNSDVSKEGLNASLMSAIGIKKWSFFNKDHLGLIGNLEKGIKIKELIPKLKSSWYLDNIKFSGNPENICKTIAIIGGSGGEYYQNAYDKKADLFITSEIKWHHFIGAAELGINIIEVCHSIESFFMFSIRDLLKDNNLPVIEESKILDIKYF